MRVQLVRDAGVRQIIIYIGKELGEHVEPHEHPQNYKHTAKRVPGVCVRLGVGLLQVRVVLENVHHSQDDGGQLRHPSHVDEVVATETVAVENAKIRAEKVVHDTDRAVPPQYAHGEIPQLVARVDLAHHVAEYGVAGQPDLGRGPAGLPVLVVN